MNIIICIILSFIIFSLSEIITIKIEKYLVEKYPQKFKWLAKEENKVYNDINKD